MAVGGRMVRKEEPLPEDIQKLERKRKMAFEFTLSTVEIREIMFDFIKPVKKNTWIFDFEVGYINWFCGVYDDENKFFITYVNMKSDNIKYILIDGNGSAFYIIADRYKHTLSEFPEELKEYKEIISKGIKLYNNESKRDRFIKSFSAEQKIKLDEINENMKDRCSLSVDIKCYEDAEKLFNQENFNYHHISDMYNKNTVANFDKYMSDNKMRTIRGEKYRNVISKISTYNNTLSEEEYKNISQDFGEAGNLVVYNIDDIYVDKTFEVIKKAYFAGVISVGYTGFIQNYIRKCVGSFPQKVNNLAPILDFINENMKNDSNFKELEFYRKELDRLIYNKIEGFYFVLTTDEQREKMFTFLKPRYKSGFEVMNINWTTGVYDRKSGIFLTQIYYCPDGVTGCGVHYNSYIVIIDSSNIFKVDNNDEYEKGTYDFRIPEQYSSLAEKVKEGIKFYGNRFEYRRSLSEDKENRLKAIESIMDDRCHQNFVIRREEHARRLFVKLECNDVIIKKIYNKKTVENFYRYATPDKILLWRGNEYLRLIKKAAKWTTPDNKRSRIFIDACNRFHRGVNDTYDKQFFKAVRHLYKPHYPDDRTETAIANYISAYMDEYPDRIENLSPLVNFVKKHTKNSRLNDTLKEV